MGGWPADVKYVLAFRLSNITVHLKTFPSILLPGREACSIQSLKRRNEAVLQAAGWLGDDQRHQLGGREMRTRSGLVPREPDGAVVVLSQGPLVALEGELLVASGI